MSVCVSAVCVCVSECGTFGDHDKCVHDTFDVVIYVMVKFSGLKKIHYLIDLYLQHCNVLTTCVSYIW